MQSHVRSQLNPSHKTRIQLHHHSAINVIIGQLSAILRVSYSPLGIQYGWPSFPPQHLLPTISDQALQSSICGIQLRQGIYVIKKDLFWSRNDVRHDHNSEVHVFWCDVFQSYSQASKENGHGHEFIEEERAPSTAEAFKKIAEEKIREAQQGVASQTAEKVFDGTEAATLADSDDLQSVNRRYEEHEEGADYRRRSGDQSDGVKGFSNKAE